MGVWTSGVSESLFNRENSISESVKLRKKFGLNGKFIVFYHGVFTPTRALKETVEAVKLLALNYSDIVFFLLGNGSSSESLKILIQREGLSKKIIIHDSVDQVEVPQFIGMCDVGLFPYLIIRIGVFRVR